jgi:hypothetical protein
MAFVAEVRARLGLDTTEFSRGLTKAQVDVSAAGADMGKKLQRAFGAGDVFRGLLAGIGIGSIQGVVEQISRLWTGVTKEIETGYEKAIEAQERLANESIRRMRQMASLETQYQLLLIERERLERGMGRSVAEEKPGWVDAMLKAISEAPLPTAIRGAALAGLMKRGQARGEQRDLTQQEADIKASLRMFEIEDEITAVQKKQGAARERYAAATIELNRMQEENRMAQMTSEEKLAALEEKRSDVQATIALSGDDDLTLARELERLKSKILSVEKQISDENKRQREEQDKAKKAVEDAQAQRNKAAADLAKQTKDRSGLTIQQVAAGEFQVTQPQRAQAREVLRLEEQAKRQRATGFEGAAGKSTERALALRKRIGSLVSGEADPMGQLREALRDSQKTQEEAKETLKKINERLVPAKIR